MKKMRLVGLSDEKDVILDVLQKTGAVELKECEEIENTHARLDTNELNDVNGKLARLSNALEFLESQKRVRENLAKKKVVEYEPPKKPLVATRTDVLHEDFHAKGKNSDEAFRTIDELDRIAFSLSEIKGKRAQLETEITALKPYEDLDVALSSVKDSKNVVMEIGLLPSTSIGALNSVDDEAFSYEIVKNGGSDLTVFIAYHKAAADSVYAKLTDMGFSRTNIECDEVPSKRIEEIKEEIKRLDEEEIALNGDAMANYPKVDDLKLLYDYYSYEKEKIERTGDFRRTEGELAVGFEAWVPEKQVERVEKALLEKTDRVYIELEDPKEDEMPPTLSDNGPVMKAYESVTNMYSVPSYYESDPTFSVMLFYFLFFGFMLSDAGYGLILAIAGALILKFVKLEPGMKNLVIVIALGGVSTILWGLLFGGFFSIEIEGTFLEKLCWFSPLENPIGVLGLSLGIGVVQILYGLALKARELIKHGHALDAVLDIGSWYLVFIGVGLYALSMVEGFAAFATPGLIVAGIGLVVIVLTGGRKEATVPKKIIKGLASLYDIVNYVSDILSYARLFGLGLATGVVGMVFNRIAAVFVELLGPIAGGVVAFIFIIVGHLMNMAINVLGAYVHDCRLQYIEFFGKFYEGGGHMFVPFGSRTKYVNIKNNI